MAERFSRHDELQAICFRHAKISGMVWLLPKGRNKIEDMTSTKMPGKSLTVFEGKQIRQCHCF